MSNVFDSLKVRAYDIVSDTMGYDAVWTPSDGSEAKTARVLLNDPTEQTGFGKRGGSVKGLADFDPNMPWMEWRVGHLVGLKEAVDEKKRERIVINGVTFRVTKVTQKYDGDSYYAQLDQVT